VAGADQYVASGTGANGKGPILSFSGDADEGVVLFGQAAIAEEEEEGDEEDAEGEDGEPEDDFNAAWEVLELARAIYEKAKDEDDEVKMKLAETYIALGDVSLETGTSIFYLAKRPHNNRLFYREIRPSHHRLLRGTRAQAGSSPDFIASDC
jgi:hypothetical protein